MDRRLIRLQRMRRGVLTRSRLMVERFQKGGFRFRAALVTLTYRPGDRWSARHVSSFCKAAAEFLKRRGIPVRYSWVLELTRASVPHYHVLWLLPRGVTLPKPDKRGWWPHGLTRIEWARNAVGYLAKYASKGTEQDDLPKGARLHGGGGLEAADRLEFSWWRLPRWAREAFSVEDRARRVRGGFLSQVTGEFRASPWSVSWHSPDWRFVNMRRTDAVPSVS